MKTERLMIRLDKKIMEKLKKEALKGKRRTGELARVIIENFLQK